MVRTRRAHDCGPNAERLRERSRLAGLTTFVRPREGQLTPAGSSSSVGYPERPSLLTLVRIDLTTYTGTTLGPYAVTAKIGEGGMGEVYRARDIKLDRDVALKVLPQAFTEDPEGLSRSLLIFASGDCGVILCDSLGGRLLLGFEITEG